MKAQSDDSWSGAPLVVPSDVADAVADGIGPHGDGGGAHQSLGPDAGQRALRGVFTLAQLLGAVVATLVLGFGLGMQFVDRTGKTPDAPNNVSVGFLNDMLDHHDQAVEMATVTLGKPSISGSVKLFATEILIFQRWEIGLMDARFDAWGIERSDDQVAMAWMGMATTPERMPGMANDKQMASLRNATGREADRLFLTLMREHHRGGVHMAETASLRANDQMISALASRMAYNQRVEIAEYTRALESLAVQT